MSEELSIGLSDERKKLWKTDDELIAALLDHIDKKTFNVFSWKIIMPDNNVEIKYNDLVNGLSHYPPKLSFVNTSRALLTDLPRMLDMDKKELFSVFKRLTMNMEERARITRELIDELADKDSYIEELHINLSRVQKLLSDKTEELLAVNQRLINHNSIMKAVADEQIVVDKVLPFKEPIKEQDDLTTNNEELKPTRKY